MWQGREITGETNWGCSVCSLVENSGVTVWPGCLILDPPASPATTKWPLQKWPCQSQHTWPACSEPDHSFEAWGFPVSCRGCMGMEISIHTPGSTYHLIAELCCDYRQETFSLMQWKIELFYGSCYSRAVLYIFTDVKSTLNTPLSASSFPPWFDPTTLLITRVAVAAVYNNCQGRSITSTIQWYCCLQYNGVGERPPAAAKAHWSSHRNNCQLAFALSGAVWLSHRAIIMTQPRVRLGLQGETKWSCVITFSPAFPYYRTL